MTSIQPSSQFSVSAPPSGDSEVAHLFHEGRELIANLLSAEKSLLGYQDKTLAPVTIKGAPFSARVSLTDPAPVELQIALFVNQQFTHVLPAIPSVANGDAAISFPPHFDAKRETPYAINIISIPDDADLNAVTRSLDDELTRRRLSTEANSVFLTIRESSLSDAKSVIAGLYHFGPALDVPSAIVYDYATFLPVVRWRLVKEPSAPETPMEVAPPPPVVPPATAKSRRASKKKSPTAPAVISVSEFGTVRAVENLSELTRGEALRAPGKLNDKTVALLKESKRPLSMFFAPKILTDGLLPESEKLVEKKKIATLPSFVSFPANFDANRMQAYPVEFIIVPDGATVADFAKAAASNNLNGPTDKVRIVLDGNGHSADTFKNVLTFALTNAFLPLNIDLSSATLQTLPADSSKWPSALQGNDAQPLGVTGPVVFTGKRFEQWGSTVDYQNTFPPTEKTAEIPFALMKTNADKGRFVTSVMHSEALGKKMRYATYFPPGFDPDTEEKYPVLVLLPGKGMKLNQWTSAGQLIPTLDSMMSGDNQKMVVVIPDMTDSLWFDYDNNGDGDFGVETLLSKPEDGPKFPKRNFEGFLIGELLGETMDSYKGDSTRVSIDGISRGGFGAMQIGLRHPTWFGSVGAESAPLDLPLQAPGDVLKTQGWVAQQFGQSEKGAIAADAYNPTSLLARRDRNEAMPRLRVAIGVDDPLFVDQNMRFAELAAKENVDITFDVYAGTEASKKAAHNFDLWVATLPGVVAFHQSTYGKAGQSDALRTHGLVNARASAVEAYQKAQAELRNELAAGVQAQMKKAVATLRELLANNVSGIVAYEELGGRLKDIADSIDDDARAVQFYVSEFNRVKDTAPDYLLNELYEGLESCARSVEQKLRTVRSAQLGKPIATLSSDISAEEITATFAKLTDKDQANISAIVKRAPALALPLAQLAQTRPQVFGKVEASSKEPFTTQLRIFVENAMEKNEIGGVSEFLKRMAEQRFDWRRGGFSHSVCAAMNRVFNEPGLIPLLVTTARRNKQAEVYTLGDADKRDSLGLNNDWKAGFLPVDADSIDKLPAASLGYERALLRTLVKSPIASLDHRPEHFARTNGPVAVAMSKLFGSYIYYGYLFKMRTGADLIEAARSQGEDGLALADVNFTNWPGFEGEELALHFPVFKVDDARQMMIVQEWKRGPQEIPLAAFEKINIVTKLPSDRKKIEGAGGYFTLNEAMQKFITPDWQSNAETLKGYPYFQVEPTPPTEVVQKKFGSNLFDDSRFERTLP